jgi:death on curing protein
MAIQFIPDEIVPIIHADLIKRYGGASGIRDRDLLASALAQPKMTAQKRFLHRTIFEKAAAYGFHVCRNHPFVDGNKRVAFVLMDIFLQKNGWELIASEQDTYETMIALASGNLSKPSLATWLKDHSTKLPPQ